MMTLISYQRCQWLWAVLHQERWEIWLIWCLQATLKLSDGIALFDKKTQQPD